MKGSIKVDQALSRILEHDLSNPFEMLYNRSKRRFLIFRDFYVRFVSKISSFWSHLCCKPCETVSKFLPPQKALVSWGLWNMLYRLLDMDRREIEAARCYVFGRAPCTLPQLYVTWEPGATWAYLRIILAARFKLVDDPIADKSVIRVFSGSV